MSDVNSRNGSVAPRRGEWRTRRARVVAACALGIALGVAAIQPTVAQTPEVPANSRDELRPLTANSMDIAAGKQLALRFCADCHGQEGISTIANVPIWPASAPPTSIARCAPTWRARAATTR